jgi:hypothetical protein
MGLTGYRQKTDEKKAPISRRCLAGAGKAMTQIADGEAVKN